MNSKDYGAMVQSEEHFYPCRKALAAEGASGPGRQARRNGLIGESGCGKNKNPVSRGLFDKTVLILGGKGGIRTHGTA